MRHLTHRCLCPSWLYDTLGGQSIAVLKWDAGYAGHISSTCAAKRAQAAATTANGVAAFSAAVAAARYRDAGGMNSSLLTLRSIFSFITGIPRLKLWENTITTNSSLEVLDRYRLDYVRHRGRLGSEASAQNTYPP
ncbi:hypothetical protein HAX54_001437 [Datura stramonium]|uniref:Uncharacterized protein n=1 Tax=Datura stramonium TaxID=4076 RepID=A0ABS8T355_DATST|nr:hypothetical protein [Datura stramonium]